MASLTKIMTLTIVLEALDRERFPHDIINARTCRLQTRQPIWPETGEQMTLNELLRDCRWFRKRRCRGRGGVPRRIGTRLRDLMNKRQELGLTNSYFLNSTGLPLKAVRTYHDGAGRRTYAPRSYRTQADGLRLTANMKIRADTTGIPVRGTATSPAPLQRCRWHQNRLQPLDTVADR